MSEMESSGERPMPLDGVKRIQSVSCCFYYYYHYYFFYYYYCFIIIYYF